MCGKGNLLLHKMGIIYIIFYFYLIISNTFLTLKRQVLCMLACWIEDPDGISFKKHLARIPDYLWVAEDGMKMQVSRVAFFYKAVESRDPKEVMMYLTKYGICAQSFGSQQWDTGFAIQALLASNFTDEIGDVLKRGHDFIKKSQVCYFSLLELKSFALIMK
jgi:hypothetical protein